MPQQRRVEWLLLAVACLACDARLPDAQNAAPDTPSNEVASEDPEAAPEPSLERSATAPEAAAAPLIGRWQGDSLCLELYSTGEFELSLLGSGPKIVLTGTAQQRPADGDDAIELVMRSARIVRHRWVGPCRKTVVRAAELDEQNVLGVTFKKGASSTVNLRATLRGRELELCGERCETLTGAEPRLAGRWRDPRALHNADPAGGWRVGDVVDLKLAPGNSSSLWIGLSETAYFTAYGEAELRRRDDGRFELTFTPRLIVDVPEGMDKAKLELLGGPIAIGESRRLTARRRVNWRIELCGSGERCVTLPSFDTIL